MMTKTAKRSLIVSGNSWMEFAKQSYSDKGRLWFLEKALEDYKAAGAVEKIEKCEELIRRIYSD